MRHLVWRSDGLLGAADDFPATRGRRGRSRSASRRAPACHASLARSERLTILGRALLRHEFGTPLERGFASCQGGSVDGLDRSRCRGRTAAQAGRRLKFSDDHDLTLRIAGTCVQVPRVLERSAVSDGLAFELSLVIGVGRDDVGLDVAMRVTDVTMLSRPSRSVADDHPAPAPRDAGELARR